MWILLLMSCASGGLMGSICAYALFGRLRKRFSIRPSAQLSNEVTQLRSDLDSISVTVKRLHAKYGMRALRGQRAAAAASSSVEMLPGETRAQWKERMMRRVFGRGGPTNDEGVE